jgi:glycerol transport system ATP-binding protein
MQYGPVDEVYHKPQFMEVGAYFSHPTMNIFECRLIRENGNLWLKATDQLKVAVDQFKELLTNEHYMLGIRAHALATRPETDGMIPVTATVELGEVVGSDTELHLDHEGISLIALLQGVETYEIGNEVKTYLYPDRFFIFDKVSGEMIARTHV